VKETFGELPRQMGVFQLGWQPGGSGWETRCVVLQSAPTWAAVEECLLAAAPAPGRVPIE
jgi:hypothetical protein